MLRPALGCASLALACAPLAGAGAESCLVCASGSAESRSAPLTVEIVSDLEFSRMALTGRQEGKAKIDPQTGSRKIEGGLVGLGGLTFKGRARVTGQPLRSVRIELPATITMTAPGGGKAELTDLVTDAPAVPTLDSAGRLEFGFGGRLTVTGGGGGNFRGRIPISVDYN